MDAEGRLMFNLHSSYTEAQRRQMIAAYQVDVLQGVERVLQAIEDGNPELEETPLEAVRILLASARVQADPPRRAGRSRTGATAHSQGDPHGTGSAQGTRPAR
jgi:hypothetical protein